MKQQKLFKIHTYQLLFEFEELKNNINKQLCANYQKSSINEELGLSLDINDIEISEDVLKEINQK